MKTTITAAALAAMVFGAGAAMAAPSAEQICESSQHGAVGKYAQCVSRAEQRLALGGNQHQYTSSLSRCTARFETAWQGLEQAAQAQGTTCPSATDNTAFQAFLDACNQSVAEALEGGELISDPVTCNNDLMTCRSDLTACNGGLAPEKLDACNVGTATVADVLAGRTFSSAAGVGVTGTMPDNGAVALVPTTSNQAIPAGFHNGLGKCQGDVDLLAANIRSGVNLFGIVGTSIKATGSALPEYVVEGVTYSNSSGAQVGTMVNRRALRVYPGAKDAKIPAGFHNGFGACAGDADLVPGNIRSGVTMWGVTGTLLQASGDATAAQVLEGSTFSNDSGSDTGTMTNVGQQHVTPGTSPVTITEGYHDGTGSVDGDADLVASNIKNGVNVFGVTGTLVIGSGIGLPRTGQTTSYGTGSDGNVHAGASRSFTDNGDGTVTDNTTGLMWEKKDDAGGVHDYGNSYTWSTGTDNLNGTLVTTFLASLNGGGGFAGHTDWRLPNLNELESLRNLQAVAPATYSQFASGCAPGCTVTTCSCTPSSLYWTSSTYLDFPSYAWTMNFTDGDVQSNLKTDTASVRAVRGGL